MFILRCNQSEQSINKLNFIYLRLFIYGNRGGSVSIESDYGLDDRAMQVQSPAEAKGFFLYPVCSERL
jgi:hypothetical protein